MFQTTNQSLKSKIPTPNLGIPTSIETKGDGQYHGEGDRKPRPQSFGQNWQWIPEWIPVYKYIYI